MEDNVKFKKINKFDELKYKISVNLKNIFWISDRQQISTNTIEIEDSDYCKVLFDVLPNANDEVKILHYCAYALYRNDEKPSETLLSNKYKNDIYIVFNNYVYYSRITDDYSDEQIILLFKKSIFDEDAKFKKLKKEIELYEKVNLSTNQIVKRVPIPEEVKFEVWRRDEGKCVICNSNQNLEFDHIIPFSKGGSNTARNLQLLCETCNRKKSNKI